LATGSKVGTVDIREHPKIYSVSDHSERGGTNAQFYNSHSQWRGSSNSCAGMLDFLFAFSFVKLMLDILYREPHI
jgi:hypothetical protein